MKIPKLVHNLTGRRFVRLSVIKFAGLSPKHEGMWLCKCNCGKVVTIQTYRLNRGDAKSCGCLHREKTATANLRHGLYGTKVYKVWDGIIDRCENQNSKNYHNYGGRGIRVCCGIRKSPSVIVASIGKRPEGHSIDRIENNSHYSCGSCSDCVANNWPLNIRWATSKQQLRNTRVNTILEINGEKKCLIEWAEYSGLTRLAISQRIKRGWPKERWLEPCARSV